MEAYTYRGQVNCNVDFDENVIKGKTAIVTGGADGIGRQYALALSNAGAYVVVGDINKTLGEQLDSKVPNLRFVVCDVTQWDDQVQLFKTALEFSPNGCIDYVIANAGILGNDDLFAFEEDQQHPTKPTLKVTQVNLIAVMYTCKLALHYFRRQHSESAPKDTCLILQGSLAGYVDVAGSPQYNASKFGVRGILRCLRQTSHTHGTRINYIAPWFVKTKILTESDISSISKAGTPFARVEDAVEAMMRSVCDRTVHGRAFAVVPPGWQPRGYVDIDDDDYIPSKHWLGDALEQAKVPSQYNKL